MIATATRPKPAIHRKLARRRSLAAREGARIWKAMATNMRAVGGGG